MACKINKAITDPAGPKNRGKTRPKWLQDCSKLQSAGRGLQNSAADSANAGCTNIVLARITKNSSPYSEPTRIFNFFTRLFLNLLRMKLNFLQFFDRFQTCSSKKWGIVYCDSDSVELVL